MSRLLSVALCALAALLVACGDEKKDEGPRAGADKPPAERPAEDPPAGEDSGPPSCQEVEAPEPRSDGGAKRPTEKLPPGAKVTVVFHTNCGEITLRLDQATAPKTAASFAALAEGGFFDGTVFHRIVPGFVIQGGDPTGTGTGGAGYSTVDVPPRDAAYGRGVVSMAKSATEPPGTGSSQFYIVTAPDAGLPPEYALVGKVVKGMAVVDAISEQGDPASGGNGTPLMPVVIEKTEVGGL